MLTIAIDSSQDICTIALGNRSQTLLEYHFYHKMNLLRRILPVIEQVMDDAGHQLSELDGVIASLGPGSFTGLRIGVPVAKSLAFALGKPIVGVPTLDAIARGVANSATEFICPMIFARAGEVYWSVYDFSGEVRVGEYAVSPIEEVMENLSSRGGSVRFCGTGATRNTEAIHHRFGSHAVVSQPWMDFARGAALLEIGGKRLESGLHDDPMTLVPMYLKKPTPVIRLETGEFEAHARRGNNPES